MLKRHAANSPLVNIGIGLVLSLFSPLTARAELASADPAYNANSSQGGRASDTGFAGMINSSGGYSQSVPLGLPPERSGIPLPLSVSYGGRRMGAAGVGWDIPLSYVQRNTSVAHRLPELDSSGFPLGRERVTLVLNGTAMQLMKKGDQAASMVWVPMRDAPQLELHDIGAGVWVLYDGSGRTYTFSAAGVGTAGNLDGGNLSLLRSITAPGGDAVKLGYNLTTPGLLDGSTPWAIDLARITYNVSPTNSACYKSDIVLTYNPPSATPLSVTMLSSQVLVRMDTLKTINIQSRPNDCTSGPLVLRRYLFNYTDSTGVYAPDLDTGLPLLHSVQMSGRDGTTEASTMLPLATYSYGTATTGSGAQRTLRYSLTQQIPVDATAAMGQSLVFLSDDQKGLNTWASLIDFTGDGRPDLIYPTGSSIQMAANMAASFGGTAFNPAWLQPTTVLSDLDSNHVNSLPFGRETINGDEAQGLINKIYRQAIDFNGDGRIDIIDAHAVPDQWVIYLNTPGPDGPANIVWQKRTIDILPLWHELHNRGFDLESDYVPLSQRHTGTSTTRAVCFEPDASQPSGWKEFTDPFTQGCEETNPVKVNGSVTFIEWELRDFNGDGYPDFLFNGAPTYDGVDIKYPAKGFNAGQHNHTISPALTLSTPSDPVSNVRVSGSTVWMAMNFTGPHLNSTAAGGGPIAVTPYPFAGPVQIRGPHPASCGVGMWSEPLPAGGVAPDGTSLPVGIFQVGDQEVSTQECGYLDVNGDGLADRVESDGGYHAYLQVPGGVFLGPTVVLPGPPQGQGDNRRQECSRNTASQTEQTSALRDINGDGIPDYVSHSFNHQTVSFEQTVRFGTGMTFGNPVPISVVDSNIPGLAFSLSSEYSPCSASASANTQAGFYDMDGDGIPEMVRQDAGSDGSSGLLDVYQLTDNGAAWGRPSSGRLVQVDNGYGASTRIGYRSAKEDTFQTHQVPFPEIVATQLDTFQTAAQQDGSHPALSATSYHAFGNPEMVYDSVNETWVFGGYRRTIELHLTNGTEGMATVTDTFGSPALPVPVTSSPPTADRYLANLVVGRPLNVSVLSGALGSDPWALLSASGTQHIIRNQHFQYAANLYQEVSARNCFEMAYPYDDSLSHILFEINGFKPCVTRGFAYTSRVDSYEGDPAPASTANLNTHVTASNVDDYGNVKTVVQSGDGETSIETDTAYWPPAIPTGAPRILSAPFSRTVKTTDGGLWAAENWIYDNASIGGAVTNGFLTSHSVNRFIPSGGPSPALIGQDVVTVVNDPSGSGIPQSATTTRQNGQGVPDGASRTVIVGYDQFGLMPTSMRVDTTGGGPSPSPIPLITAIGRDPYTLKATSNTSPTGESAGVLYDGFDRPKVQTLTPVGGTPGAVAAYHYLGFSTTESGGRSVQTTTFTDAVDPQIAPTAPGHLSITYLDALGRIQYATSALGADYANQAMISSARTYDLLGRVVFEAFPFPSTQSSATAYGVTRYFNTDGTPNCYINGNGPQPFTQTVDESHDIYPSCFQQAYQNHQKLLSSRNADSFLTNGQQNGVIQTVAFSAFGNKLNHSTWQNGNRLEYADFGYDPLRRMTQMRRYADPSLTQSVTTKWVLDSVGNTVEFDAPDTQPRKRSIDSWGELLDEQWLDGSVVRHSASSYDALGRLIHHEERNDSTVDSETVKDYVYDTPAPVTGPVVVTPTNMLGRLSQAISATGAVSFSYDALGRVNSQVFTDDQGGLYLQKSGYHFDGELQNLDLFLPDNGYRDDQVTYAYDSAERARSVQYSDGLSTEDLFEATTIDPFGRIRAASYGGTQFSADFADTGRRLPFSSQIRAADGSFWHTIAFAVFDFQPFDPVGRERARQEASSTQPTVENVTRSEYDALGQLARSTSTSTDDSTQIVTKLPIHNFMYDRLGNLGYQFDSDPNGSGNNTQIAGMGNLDAADWDRPLVVAYSSNSGIQNLVYNNAGDITQMPTNTGSTRTIDYLAGGLARTISDSAGGTAHFHYDAFGNVQALDVSTPASINTRHDRHYGALIGRRWETLGSQATASVVTRSIPGPGGLLATRHGASSTWIFGFGEGKGSRFFTDSNGHPVQSLNYQPYGMPDGNSLNELPTNPSYSTDQWNGGDWLETLGVTQLGARIYDPVLGRFLSRDPLFVPRTATTTNAYAFAMNDPVNSADPSGLDPCLSGACGKELQGNDTSDGGNPAWLAIFSGGGPGFLGVQDRLAHLFNNDDSSLPAQVWNSAQDQNNGPLGMIQHVIQLEEDLIDDGVYPGMSARGVPGHKSRTFDDLASGQVDPFLNPHDTLCPNGQCVRGTLNTAFQLFFLLEGAASGESSPGCEGGSCGSLNDARSELSSRGAREVQNFDGQDFKGPPRTTLRFDFVNKRITFDGPIWLGDEGEHFALIRDALGPDEEITVRTGGHGNAITGEVTPEPKFWARDQVPGAANKLKLHNVVDGLHKPSSGWCVDYWCHSHTAQGPLTPPKE